MDLNWWTLEDVWRKLQSEHVGELADDAKEAIEKCYGFLQETIANADEGAIYGVNTGLVTWRTPAWITIRCKLCSATSWCLMLVEWERMFPN